MILNIPLGKDSPFVIRSESTSSSSSYAGLPSDVRNKYKNFLFPLMSPHLGGLLGGVFRSALTGTPNQNIWSNLTNTAFKQYQTALRPAIYNTIRKAIGNLAQRGILDSSIAIKTLGHLTGQYQTALGSYLAQLQQKALFYPIDVMKTAGSVYPSMLNALRYQASSSSSSSKHYNPSPAIGLFGSLVGL